MSKWWNGLLAVWRNFFFNRRPVPVIGYTLVGLWLTVDAFMGNWAAGLFGIYAIFFFYPAYVWRMDHFKKQYPSEAGSLRHLARGLNVFEPYQR
jgi:hypothetical protein